MSGYLVTATQWAGGWELEIFDGHGDQVGVTQCVELERDAAEEMVRDYLRCDGHPEPHLIEINVS